MTLGFYRSSHQLSVANCKLAVLPKSYCGHFASRLICFPSVYSFFVTCFHLCLPCPGEKRLIRREPVYCVKICSCACAIWAWSTARCKWTRSLVQGVNIVKVGHWRELVLRLDPISKHLDPSVQWCVSPWEISSRCQHIWIGLVVATRWSWLLLARLCCHRMSSPFRQPGSPNQVSKSQPGFLGGSAWC